PNFVPLPNTVFFDRTNIKLNLYANDDDPYDLDPQYRPLGPGGPSTTTVLRWTVTIRGLTLSGSDTTYVPPGAFRVNTPAITVAVRTYILGTPADGGATREVWVAVQLCDCAECEGIDGSGRCILASIPIKVPPASSPKGPSSPASSSQGPPRP